ncbi:uncharacterized protein SPPG_04048 [Spizellomyces punctatus DAOM BR117]|uniref:Uncharacterized protein n=1 Tax=Spizellomyces punctatus (strain DAOM BR117) TaxID=645134 RepID=A0A0L0HIJ6_SPIPD|nr:uncharacterized protein SPPG_04048 [Spizellomyces punctatus DAOM BR117]KND00947.1 hypothetical protein SPPG_04048 [Spizellomyces punctatus DAOM BR117]|eukprot:XP_016608986.1 hypothetical protein SPPG_04048 [Spizellomyces punctatus DAOM BR117]
MDPRRRAGPMQPHLRVASGLGSAGGKVSKGVIQKPKQPKPRSTETPPSSHPSPSSPHTSSSPDTPSPTLRLQRSRMSSPSGTPRYMSSTQSFAAKVDSSPRPGSPRGGSPHASSPSRSSRNTTPRAIVRDSPASVDLQVDVSPVSSVADSVRGEGRKRKVRYVASRYMASTTSAVSKPAPQPVHRPVSKPVTVRSTLTKSVVESRPERPNVRKVLGEQNLLRERNVMATPGVELKRKSMGPKSVVKGGLRASELDAPRSSLRRTMAETRPSKSSSQMLAKAAAVPLPASPVPSLAPPSARKQSSLTQSNPSRTNSSTPIEDTILALENRLLQWTFLRANAQKAFEEKKRQAEAEIYTFWQRVTELREEVHGEEETVRQMEELVKVIGPLREQEKAITEAAQALEAFSKGYDTFMNGLRRSVDWLPMKGVMISDAEELRNVLKDTTEEMRHVLQDENGHIEQIAMLSNRLAALRDAIQQTTTEMDECVKLAQELARMELVEKSFVIGRLQMNEKKREGWAWEGD